VIRFSEKMTKRFLVPVAGSLSIIVILSVFSAFSVQPAAESLSARLTDQEFWRLSSDLSEPNGFFRSDNILSNELWFQYVIPDLTRTAKSGRVYLGVGPEQNFTYIAALKPKMVFIFDIRRGNLALQLMYKALFELSADRAEFVSRLFSRVRPEGLGPNSSAQRIFAAFRNAEFSEALYAENFQAIKDHLLIKHRFPLADADIEGIEHVYRHFYQFGPRINYNSSLRTGYGGFGGFNRTTYADLMSTDDGQGQARSYLASEENFGFLKEMESKNLIVPVVGDFAGPKAIRAVAAYLKERGATVSAFYLSNVEQYLEQNGVWNDFCRNVMTLPLDETSTFIRSVRDGQYGFGRGLSSELGNMNADVAQCGDPVR
jgi:hypothetical protein